MDLVPFRLITTTNSKDTVTTYNIIIAGEFCNGGTCTTSDGTTGDPGWDVIGSDAGGYLHPEDKSLAPDGKSCNAYTRGLLQRRPIKALPPFILIGKEIERRGQEGEEISVLEIVGPIQYSQRQTLKTRPCAPELVKRINRFSLSQLERSGLTRDTIIRARRGERVHPSTCARLARTLDQLERGPCERRVTRGVSGDFHH